MKKILLSLLALVAIATGAKAQDMTATPLTLEAVEAGTITIHNRSALALTYTSSVNGAQTTTANPVTIDVAAGETIALECNNTTKSMNFNITSSNDIYVYGNAMSLVFGSDFVGKTDLTGCAGEILSFLFCLEPEGSTQNTTIRNHPTKDIVLPATTLSSGCYMFMFSGCSNLMRGPELPATTLAEDCYHRMFEYTGLIMAPALPATSLSGQVYGGMFDHCANLRYVKCLASDIVDTSYGDDATTDCWLANVATTGTFVKADVADWSVKTKKDEAFNGIPEGWTVKNASDFDPYATPLTLEAVEAGIINIHNPNVLTIEYSKDGTTWTSANSNPISIAVSAGEQVRFRGDNPAYDMFGDHGEQPTQFTATNDVYVYGNVMSLISSTGYPTLATLPQVGGNDEYDSDVNLAFLFCAPGEEYAIEPKANTTIRNHPTKDLVLPAINVTRSGYMYMFASCEGLTRAPELPATDLGWGCYHRMFDSCTGLEKAPVLPAATVPMSAYSFMFNGCSNLNYVKCLATNISADDSTLGWLTGVATTGTFIKAAGMGDWTVGPQGQWNEVNGIPAGWTAMTTTEYAIYETPLTFEAVEDGTVTVAWDEYSEPTLDVIQYKLNGGEWTNVAWNTPICVAANDVISFRGDNGSCYDESIWAGFHFQPSIPVYVYGNMMSLIAKDGFATNTTLDGTYNFYRLFQRSDYAPNKAILNHPTKDIVLPATTLTPYCYDGLFADAPNISRAPKLPATTLADWCYCEMFSGTAITTAPALPATTLAEACYADMFMNCENLTTAPDLPAATLAEGCYTSMFAGCTSLNYVKCLATDISADYCTTNWLGNVAATGTFVKTVGMTAWAVGPDADDNVNGIPAGWTVSEMFDYTVPASGVGTFSATKNMRLPSGLTAHYCTTFDAGTSNITVVPVSGDVIPAATGVLLRGEAGKTYVMEVTTDDAPVVSGNALVAVTEPTHVAPTDGDYTNFMLSNGTFIRIANSASDVKMPANKAYLQILTASLIGSTRIGLLWDDSNMTAIDTADADRPTTDGVLYDLQGRRVSNAGRGLYIQNGRKIFIK